MRIKKELNTKEVAWIKGRVSRDLTDRCPDRLVVFPSVPCTNIGCEYAIKQAGYMNCSFLAAEAGEHTLEAIGEMMGITREGVRLIETRAMKKLRLLLSQDPGADDEKRTTTQEPRLASGRSNVRDVDQSDQLEDSRDILPAFDDRKLGKCKG